MSTGYCVLFFHVLDFRGPESTERDHPRDLKRSQVVPSPPIYGDFDARDRTIRELQSDQHTATKSCKHGRQGHLAENVQIVSY